MAMPRDCYDLLLFATGFGHIFGQHKEGPFPSTAKENADAAKFVDPNGAYGPNTCISGYVWREAFDGDQVCVTPEIREQVREDNRVGPSRWTYH